MNLSAALQATCPEGQANSVGEMGRLLRSNVGLNDSQEKEEGSLEVTIKLWYQEIVYKAGCK